jgi:hypothetical protein
MSLEERLRKHLRPVDPGAEFADRVLQRLAASKPLAPAPGLRHAAPRWALAATVLLAVGAGALIHQQREHDRGAAAARQLALALEVTSRELETLHQHLDRQRQE